MFFHFPRPPLITFLGSAIALSLAVILRISLLPYESTDVRDFISPWYDYIVAHGGFPALKDNFANYTPPYLYLLVFVSTYLASLSKLTAIKLITFPFEGLSAFFVYKLVHLRYPVGNLSLIAAFTLLFSPTLVLNGAYWGQCDVIYATGLLGCLYFVSIGRINWALIALGIAFSFKQQALFISPFLIVLFFRKMIRWQSFLWIPLVYLVMIIPARLAGRPLKELVSIYFNQATSYQYLTLNAPNLYQWIPNEFYRPVAAIGLIITLILIMLLITLVVDSEVKLSQPLLIQLALISVLMMPYFLPKMHDRYFFAADVFSIVFGFYYPQYFFVPIAINLVSLFTYISFFIRSFMIPPSILSLFLAGVILALLYLLNQSLYPPEDQEIK
ncbi:MAG: hypothetical protein VKJ02_07315 [Snowella sp.]|nr:hypothetical protein [Snowella sp.]